jgi:hypothetical protein
MFSHVRPRETEVKTPERSKSREAVVVAKRRASPRALGHICEKCCPSRGAATESFEPVAASPLQPNLRHVTQGSRTRPGLNYVAAPPLATSFV